MRTPDQIERHRQHRESLEREKHRQEGERRKHCPRPAADEDDLADEEEGDLGRKAGSSLNKLYFPP